MAKNTFKRVYPVTIANTTGEILLAQDILDGEFIFVQNNSPFDVNLLLFEDAQMSSTPIELAIRAGGVGSAALPLGAFAIYAADYQTIAQPIAPAGVGGVYNGSGAINANTGAIGYISVNAFDEPIYLDVNGGIGTEAIPAFETTQIWYQDTRDTALHSTTEHLSSIYIVPRGKRVFVVSNEADQPLTTLKIYYGVGAAWVSTSGIVNPVFDLSAQPAGLNSIPANGGYFIHEGICAGINSPCDRIRVDWQYATAPTTGGPSLELSTGV